MTVLLRSYRDSLGNISPTIALSCCIPISRESHWIRLSSLSYILIPKPDITKRSVNGFTGGLRKRDKIRIEKFRLIYKYRHIYLYLYHQQFCYKHLKEKNGMSNVDFSKITEGIYHVIETEEKILTGLQNDTITLKRNKQNRTSLHRMMVFHSNGQQYH